MEKKRFAGIEVPPDLNRKNFVFLYLSTFLIGILLTIPGIIQPVFLKEIINVSDEYFGSINGTLQSMAQVASLLFIGIIGILSDKTGRKPPAVAGFILLAVFYLLFLYSNSIAALIHIPADFSAAICAALSFSSARETFVPFSPGLLTAYAIRFFIGFCLVLVFPQFKTMVADYTYEKDRGKGMAFYGVMIGLGSLVVFTALAPIGRKTGVEMLFYISAGIAAAATVLSLLGLRERLPEQKSGQGRVKELLRIVNKSFPLKASYLCAFITRVDVAITPTFLIAWAVMLAPKYGLSSEAASFKGTVPMMVMGAFTLFAYPVFGILLDRWGRVPTIILTLLLGGAGFLCVASSPTPFPNIFTILGVLLIGCCVSGAVVGSSTLAADASPPELVGSTLGGLNTMAQVGMILFLFSGGVIFDKLGPGWVFITKGIINIALGIYLFIVRNKIVVRSESAH
jgi:MFS family permease